MTGDVPPLPTVPPTDRVRTGSELQAIRDPDGVPVAYELFHRESAGATATRESTTAATLAVLADLTGASTSVATGATHVYFVNVTRDVVRGLVPLPDPTLVAVLEVQPDVVADDEVVAGVYELRSQGYGIALDRFAPDAGNDHRRLLPLATHVKLDLHIDVDGGDPDALRETARLVRQESPALLVGCRIGTSEGLALARELGCDLLQGHVLDEPTRPRQRALSGSATVYLALLQELSVEDDAVDLDAVVRLVHSDPELSMRVLKACTSAAVGLAGGISSVRQAVVLVGLTRLRRSVNLAVAQGLTEGDDSQLLTVLEHAWLADLIGRRLGLPPGTGFLVGVVLEIARVLGTGVRSLLRGLPLEPGLGLALVERSGPVGRTMTLLEAYLGGDLDEPPAEVTDLVALHAEAMVCAAELAGQAGPDRDDVRRHPGLPPVPAPPQCPPDTGRTVGGAASHDQGRP